MQKTDPLYGSIVDDHRMYRERTTMLATKCILVILGSFF